MKKKAIDHCRSSPANNNTKKRQKKGSLFAFSFLRPPSLVQTFLLSSCCCWKSPNFFLGEEIYPKISPERYFFMNDVRRDQMRIRRDQTRSDAIRRGQSRIRRGQSRKKKTALSSSLTYHICTYFSTRHSS